MIERVITLIKEVNILYLIFSIIGCYLGAIALRFESKKRLGILSCINLEYNDLFSKKRFVKITLIRILTLLFLFTVSIEQYLGIWIMIMFCIPVLIFVLIKNKITCFLKLIMRYLLELPKVYFLYLALGINLGFLPALIIVTVGSIFYLITKRGFPLLEIFLFLFNRYSLNLTLELNLIIIISLRLIGIIFFILPIYVAHFYNKNFKKYSRQR